MLNENTRKGLNSLITIGNAAIVRYPWTTVLQKNKSVIAFINLEELGEEPFEEYGLEPMSDFLTLVDFYDNPEITMQKGVINIDSGLYHQRYNTSDLDTMKSFDVKVSTLDNVQKTPEVVTLEIPATDLKRFKKIASLVKATEFIVDARESGKEKIVVGKLDMTQNLSDESVVDYSMGAKSEIGIIFDMGDIQRLPDRNYSVKIMQSEKTGNCISLWEIEDDPIKIIVSIQGILAKKTEPQISQ